MSHRFLQFVQQASRDPVEASAMRVLIGDADAVSAYATSKGHSITPAQAREMMDALKRTLEADEPQALSDASLDHVSGGLNRRAHFS